MSVDQEITLDDLQKDMLQDNQENVEIKNWEDHLESWILKEYDSNSKNISEEINNIYESTLINSSLKLSNGNKTEAAKILGWGRNTISNKIKSSKI